MKLIKKISITATLLLLCCGAYSPALAAIRYVQPGGAGNCTTWANPCNLQAALAAAVSGDEIWVTGGTYLTTSGTDRSVSFILKSGVALYGGFGGTEAARSERPASGNVTTLSGINSYHVVVANGVNNTAILDRLTISGGNANGSGTDADGGGIRLFNSSPTLNNLAITGNSAQMNGGGIYNEGGNPTLTNSSISSNSAGLDGGGMYNLSASPTLTTVTFSNNQAGLEGGGIYSLLSSPRLTGITLTNNSAELDGNSLYGICAPACNGASCLYTIAGDTNPVSPFTLITYTVTPSAGPKGGIAPTTPSTVISGLPAEFAIKPTGGYHVIAPVNGTCGGSYSGSPHDTISGINYTTNAVIADCTVTASFGRNIPPTTNLLAWYPFDGNVADYSGNSHNGTPHNLAPAQNRMGKSDTAYAFDSSSYVDIANNPAFNFSSSPFTIAAWVKVSGAFSGEGGFGSIFDRQGDSSGYRIDYSTESHTIRLLGDNMALSYAATLNIDSWYHIAAVSNGASTGTIYVNGVAVGSSGGYTAGNFETNPHIGECQTIGAAPFKGVIDDVRVYNRDLSATEINDIFLAKDVTLTATINGSGTINSQNILGTNYACNSGTCPPATFGPGDVVTLNATGSNSNFSVWGGDYSGDTSINPGSITMDDDKSVTATFTPDAAKVKIDNNSTPYYTIGTALADATSAAPLPRELRAQNNTLTFFSEEIIMTNPISILLKGGYDAALANQGASDYTTIIGSLRIRGGKLIVERLKIKGL